MDTIFVAFAGKARHGKDTAARHVQYSFGGQYDIRLFAFGDALKIEMYDALMNPLHDYWATTRDYFLLPHPTERFAAREHKLAWVTENKSLLVRHLQTYGTDYRRAMDPFHWVKCIHESIDNAKPQFAFITDVRFVNELLYVKSRKGLVIKCVRQGFVDPSRPADHVSETALDNVRPDFQIDVVDGDVEELKKDALVVFGMILEQLTPKVAEDINDLVQAA